MVDISDAQPEQSGCRIRDQAGGPAIPAGRSKIASPLALIEDAEERGVLAPSPVRR